MKRKITLWLSLIVAMLFASFGAFAQEQQEGGEGQIPALPIDPAVRIGQLPNGLTYIIRHNAQPKQRANFYIAQRVGSMQEEDSQSGLAHFLEHMAFNGTRNFEEKELINYLESIGIKFGAELNAYTGFDETMYTIMDAPVARQGVVDSCLMILRDWSDGIALHEAEIDNERGVIENEWRQRDNGMMRMFTKLLEQLFPGLNYGKRMPIGSMDVVRNFTYQELRDYYHKWYRPDLQGLIIVGDIDVDYVENKIKELYADVPAPVNPAERVYEDIPDRTEPASFVLTDPEGQYTIISASYTKDAMPIEMKGTVIAFVTDYLNTVIDKMFSARMSEITLKPDAPFLQASASVGPFAGLTLTEDALEFTAVAHEGRYKEALDALAAEIKRVKEYGFTASEYDRVRIELISQYEDRLNSKENRTNTQYAMEYGKYFTTGGYIPGIDMEYTLISQMAPAIPVEQVNQYVAELFNTNNFILYMMAPEKEGLTYPTGEEFLAQYNAAMEKEVTAYEDKVTATDLIAPENLPTPGTILSVEEDTELGATRLALSNGAEVYLMPTEHKKNDIRLRAYSFGGYDAEQVDHILASALVADFGTVGGVAEFDKTDLEKVLVGKQVSVSTSVDEFEESISGSSSDKDLETMFQLMYLKMTDVRQDDDAFKAQVQQAKAILEASKANPLAPVLRDTLPEVLYPGNPYKRPLTSEEMDKIDYPSVLKLQRNRFADASDFKFFLVGSFTREQVEPLVLQYIASLPSTYSKEPNKKEQTAPLNHVPTTKHFFITADTPTAVVVDLHTGKGQYSLRNALIMDLLSEVLDQQFFKSIREEEGGTYGVSTQASVSEYPDGEQLLLVFFQTDPESTERLNSRIKEELQKVAKGEIDITEYFNKSVLNMEKGFEENQTENSYWMNVLVNKYYKGKDNHTTYLETLRSITVKDLQQALAELLDKGAYLEIVAKTEKTAAEGHAEAGVN